MATNVCTAGVPLFKRRRLEGVGGPGKGPVIAEGATATSGVAWLAMPLLFAGFEPSCPSAQASSPAVPLCADFEPSYPACVLLRALFRSILLDGTQSRFLQRCCGVRRFFGYDGVCTMRLHI